MEELTLKSHCVCETTERLCLRINDRFPGSGLGDICERLLAISRETEKTIRWISKPQYRLKLPALVVLAGVLGLVAWTGYTVGSTGIDSFADLVAMIDSVVNLLVLLAIAFVFLWSLELRVKRNRVVRSLNKLRDVAHIIDMHQLTKDPDGLAVVSVPTKHSPVRTMTAYELSRYLDYCSEMLAVIGKLGYLYVTELDDPICAAGANDIESLTTGLCRKIWQKIMILKGMSPAAAKPDDPARPRT